MAGSLSCTSSSTSAMRSSSARTCAITTHARTARDAHTFPTRHQAATLHAALPLGSPVAEARRRRGRPRDPWREASRSKNADAGAPARPAWPPPRSPPRPGSSKPRRPPAQRCRPSPTRCRRRRPPRWPSRRPPRRTAAPRRRRQRAATRRAGPGPPHRRRPPPRPPLLLPRLTRRRRQRCRRPRRRCVGARPPPRPPRLACGRAAAASPAPRTCETKGSEKGVCWDGAATRWKAAASLVLLGCATRRRTQWRVGASAPHLMTISWRFPVKHEGKKVGKYCWMKPKTSTWPSGLSGMMRMMVKGIKVSRSRAVRRSADTSRGLSVPPAAAQTAAGSPAAQAPSRCCHRASSPRPSASVCHAEPQALLLKEQRVAAAEGV